MLLINNYIEMMLVLNYKLIKDVILKKINFKEF